eukprot:GHVO01054316.1.p2 GENE.GHVO01054316.1~~GHVO01054316.1.p2  ORF type:complete len:261 (+),score=63.94 GHVO01054316.1:1085-1867(+)
MAPRCNSRKYNSPPHDIRAMLIPMKLSGVVLGSEEAPVSYTEEAILRILRAPVSYSKHHDAPIYLTFIEIHDFINAVRTEYIQNRRSPSLESACSLWDKHIKRPAPNAENDMTDPPPPQASQLEDGFSEFTDSDEDCKVISKQPVPKQAVPKPVPKQDACILDLPRRTGACMIRSITQCAESVFRDHINEINNRGGDSNMINTSGGESPGSIEENDDEIVYASPMVLAIFRKRELLCDIIWSIVDEGSKEMESFLAPFGA